MISATNAVVAYLAFTSLCWQIELTNSRTSTLWKLDSGKITTDKGRTSSFGGGSLDNDSLNGDVLMPPAAATTTPLNVDANAELYMHDQIFYIIATTFSESGTNGWIRKSPEEIEMIRQKSESQKRKSKQNIVQQMQNESIRIAASTVDTQTSPTSTLTNLVEESASTNSTNENDETLDCGKPVNFTYYDYLIGVGKRFEHPLVPEPEVAYLFLKSKDVNSFKNFDITALERRLKRAKRDRPRSVHLYNQMGNYWRIVGDARQAIECFRRALAMAPTNSDVLLNLARVLFQLQYLDDAIHLTRRSLEMQPPGRSAWQQYFTLGEIFKAYGHFQESILHLRHALELYPQHEPILKALRDLENSPTSAVHIYTLVIIMALVIAVFVVVIKSSTKSELGLNRNSTTGGTPNIGAGGSSMPVGGSLQVSNNGPSGPTCSNGQYGTDADSLPRTQRHFNRAMAMRSLKGFSARNLRHRRH